MTAVDQVESYRRNKTLKAFSPSASRPVKKWIHESDALKELSKKGGIPLNARQRVHLEDMLRDLTPEQTKIVNCMVWCLDHAESAEEVVNCIEESLSILQTTIPRKEAELTVISLIVRFCNSRATNAASFLRNFERKLPEIFRNVRDAHKTIDAGNQADRFRVFVLGFLNLWEDMSVYTSDFLNDLQSTFLDVFPTKALDSQPTLSMESDYTSPPTSTSPPRHPEGRSEDNNEAGLPVSKLDRTAGLRPLENPGWLCYANCTVQCLSNIEPLLDFCVSKASVKQNCSRLMMEFNSVVNSIWRTDQKGTSVSAKSLKKEVSKVLKAFNNDSQHDAQEFVIGLLDKLALDNSDGRNIFSDLLSGLQRSRVKCKCGHISDSYEHFWTLSLPLDAVRTQMSLFECFQLFCIEETMDENNKLECSGCKSYQIVTKQLSIIKFPPVLILHLMRFDEALTTRRDTQVSSPLANLELSEFASTVGSRKMHYNLIGVCNHFGSPSGGHYWCICRHPVSQKWHEFDNFNVKPMALDELDSADPYLYFYELQQN